ncbi:MAG: sn-glycerol 3-phosphate transport system ATP-binding protein [Chloroflexi bacterium]|jgi:ABC-type sugar transport system ATPase subunit|nr:MAG: sn-glycerol 3-phosphate transport system ATP-binding protein [Chloroflexota bacterium]
MTEIRLEGISKRYRGVVALDGVSLTVGSGELLVVVGPTGCGKTSMLRIIAGLERQDSGSVYFDGEPVDHVPLGKRGVQMVFQNYALWPHMKVMDEKKYTNLSLPLKVRNWASDSIGVRIKEAARRVGLDPALFGRKPDQLSQGQKQKVAIARALTASPRIFLMDEPLSSLDPPSRVLAREEIRKLQQDERATMLYVTHNMRDAFAMADRIAVMRDGRFVQIGAADELWAHPVEQFVLDYLQS